MIISRTPFRISFVGGGTDLRVFYKKEFGQVLSTSIDKYIYVAVKRQAEIVDFKYKNLDFTIPHKELASRSFVLFPLQEILPEWRHPKTNESVSNLIKKLPDDEKNSILKIKKS